MHREMLTSPPKKFHRETLHIATAFCRSWSILLRVNAQIHTKRTFLISRDFTALSFVKISSNARLVLLTESYGARKRRRPLELAKEQFRTVEGTS